MKKQRYTAPTVDGKGNKANYSVKASNPEQASQKMLAQGRFPMAIPEVVIGKLSYADRKSLPSSDFAVPETRQYPIPDIAHARNALARVSQFGTPAEKQRVAQAVYAKYPELNKEQPGGEAPQSLQVLARQVGNAIAYKEMHKGFENGHEKHYAALAEDHRGKEGLALVDAPNPTAARAKLEDIGVHPLHTPIEQSLKFDHGNAITKVHGDGDMTAMVRGKEVVITQDGQVYGAMPEGQGTYVKESLRNSANILKAGLIQKFQRGKLPGAPLSKNGVPMMPRKVPMHRTRHGSGVTRRSDR